MKLLRFLCSLLVTILALGILCAGGVFALILYLNSPPDAPAHSTETVSVTGGAFRIEVRPGESAASVGMRLEEAGVVRSASFWRLLTRAAPFLEEDPALKTGVYEVPLPAASREIRAKLAEGKTVLLKVTIPEGETLSKTAGLLEEAGVCGKEAFIAAASDSQTVSRYRIPAQTLEGYLYPDTYLFPPDCPPSRVVQVMVATFFRRLAEAGVDLAAYTPEALHERVILASIVEREYRDEREAAVIAGVFLNRRERGMALESCATVEYVITEIQGKPHPERIFTQDTRIASPYNTYVNRGLPPGPISSPGTVSLKAAFFPEKSGYLFFRLVDEDSGQHYFSKTFDAHIKAGSLAVKKR